MPPKQIMLPAPKLSMMLTEFHAGSREQDGTVLVVCAFQSGNFVAEVAWPYKNTSGIIDGLKQVALEAHRRDKGTLILPQNGDPKALDELAKRRAEQERRMRGK